MLQLDIPSMELFDEETDRFINIKPQTINLEHSLISISKWESIYCKPFLSKDKKSTSEILDYIRCMIINPPKGYDIVKAFSPKEINLVIEYINKPMTATTVTFFGKNKSSEKVITSELIYFWMFQAGIAIECEKWPISRLFALIKIFGAKSQKGGKMNNREYSRMQSKLNAERRAKLNSKG